MKTNVLSASIANEIKNKIRDGKYKFGDKIGTELQLAEEYKVSRTTIRSALQILKEQRYLNHDSENGFTVLIPQNKYTAGYEKTFVNYITKHGLKTNCKIISMEVCDAGEDFWNRYEIDKKTPIQIIHKVRYVDDKPALNEIITVNTKLVPDLNPWMLANDYFDNIIRTEYSIQITKSKTNINAFRPDEWEIENLGQSTDNPVMQSIAENYINTGELVYIYKCRFLDNKYGGIDSYWSDGYSAI